MTIQVLFIHKNTQFTFVYKRFKQKSLDQQVFTILTNKFSEVSKLLTRIVFPLNTVWSLCCTCWN